MRLLIVDDQPGVLEGLKDGIVGKKRGLSMFPLLKMQQKQEKI